MSIFTFLFGERKPLITPVQIEHLEYNDLVAFMNTRIPFSFCSYNKRKHEDILKAAAAFFDNDACYHYAPPISISKRTLIGLALNKVNINFADWHFNFHPDGNPAILFNYISLIQEYNDSEHDFIVKDKISQLQSFHSFEWIEYLDKVSIGNIDRYVNKLFKKFDEQNPGTEALEFAKKFTELARWKYDDGLLPLTLSQLFGEEKYKDLFATAYVENDEEEDD